MSHWLTITVWAVVGAAIGAALSLTTRRSLKYPAAPRTSHLLTTTATGAVATAVLFNVLAWRLGTRFELLPYSVLAAFSVPLAIVDTLEHRLPNRMLLVAYPTLVVLLGLGSLLRSDSSSIVRALVSMVAVAGFYLALALIFPGGLGAGDVKLGGLLGLALGWLSWSALVTATFLGWFAAALVWLLLRLTRRRPRDSLLPMGPFLLVGALLTICVMPT